MSALDFESAPYGPTAPATDFLPLAAPASDVALDPVGRSFVVVTSGTVSVTTEAGNDRTQDLPAGMVVTCAITHVLAATTADLLIYLR